MWKITDSRPGLYAVEHMVKTTQKQLFFRKTVDYY